MSDEKEFVQHIANTLYCGECWRKSLVAVSEPKYLVRLLKFYKGQYSNNTAAAKRIQKSIENEVQKEIKKSCVEGAISCLEAQIRNFTNVRSELKKLGDQDGIIDFITDVQSNWREDIEKLKSGGEVQNRLNTGDHGNSVGAGSNPAPAKFNRKGCRKGGDWHRYTLHNRLNPTPGDRCIWCGKKREGEKKP